MRIAVVLAAAALLASSCGAGKPAVSAAEVAPRSTYALMAGRMTPDLGRALAFLPESRGLERLLARARAITGSGGEAQVAVLDPRGAHAVAFARPADRKQLDRQLDAAHIHRARVSGWTVFSRQQSSIDAVRHARTHLADAPWFRPVHGDVTFIRRRGSVTAVTEGDHTRVVRSERPVGADAPQPLARLIPADAVAAAATHDGGTLFAGLPFARALRDGFGLDVATLAAAAPGDAVLFARPGAPAPTVTLLASGAPRSAAAAVVRELAPHAGPGGPATLDGLAATDVALGPVDLFYGAAGRMIFVTDDPDAHLRSGGGALAPAGLPQRTLAWAYLDAATGLPALEALAAAGGTRISAGFARRCAAIRELIVYRTRGALTVDVRQLP